MKSTNLEYIRGKLYLFSRLPSYVRVEFDLTDDPRFDVLTKRFSIWVRDDRNQWRSGMYSCVAEDLVETCNSILETVRARNDNSSN